MSLPTDYAVLQRVSIDGIDTSDPRLYIQCNIKNTNYIYIIVLWSYMTASFFFRSSEMTSSQTGTFNAVIDLDTSTQNIILNAMANDTTQKLNCALITIRPSDKKQIGSSQLDFVVSTNYDNSKPTFSSYAFQDIKNETVLITGDKQTFIQGQSLLSVTINDAAAHWGATISNYSVSINNKTISSSTSTISFGTIPDCGYLLMNVRVTDSRGYTTLLRRYITVFEYSKISISEYDIRRIDEIEPIVKLNFSGTTEPITINQNDKNILMSARIDYKKISDASYTSFAITPTSTSTGFSFSTDSLSDSTNAIMFDPESSYNVIINVFDKLTTDSVQLVVNRGIPLIALRSHMVGINKSNPGVALDVSGEIMQNNLYIQAYANEVIDDFNNYTKGGIFYCSTENLGNAPASYNHGFLEVISNGTVVLQRYTELNATCSRSQRYLTGSTWSSWVSA